MPTAKSPSNHHPLKMQMVLHLRRRGHLSKSKDLRLMLVALGVISSILSVAVLSFSQVEQVNRVIALRANTALTSLDSPGIAAAHSNPVPKASLRRLQTWKNIHESSEPNQHQPADARPLDPSSSPTTHGHLNGAEDHYSLQGKDGFPEDWKFQPHPTSNTLLDKLLLYCKNIKKFFAKLLKKVLYPGTNIRENNPKDGDEVADDLSNFPERRLGKLKIQQPVMPREDTPFSRHILPYETEKNSRYEALSALFVRWAQKNPKLKLLVTHIEGLKNTKLNPQQLDPKQYGSLANLLISEMTNAELPIQYREGEYLIFDYLLRCDDNDFVREKLYSFYERNEHFRNAVFFGSTYIYLESLQQMLEPLYGVTAVSFHKLVKAMKTLYEYAEWGKNPKKYALIEEVEKYAYRVLEDPNFTIAEKDPIFEILKRLTGFGGNSDEKFGEAIRGGDQFLSIFVLNAFSKNIKSIDDYHENAWERNALNDEEVSKRFNQLLHLESLGATVFPSSSRLKCIKITSSRVQLMRDLKKFPILFDSYETLNNIAHRFEEHGSPQQGCKLPDAKSLAKDCLDIFLNKKMKLEIDEEVWLYGALEHLKTFEGNEVLELILNRLQNEHNKLREVYNFRFMKRVCERNSFTDNDTYRHVINKANLFKKLRYETKLTDRLSSSYTLVDEIKDLVEYLKNDFVPLGSKIQLYEILQHIYGSFPNVRDPKFWAKMAEDPEVVRVSVSLGWLANPENGVLETENNFILQHVNSHESGLPLYDFVSNIMRLQKPDSKIARAEPITGFGRGMFPNFEIDLSYMKRLKAENLLVRIPITYNGPIEKERRAILVKKLKIFSENGEPTPEWMRRLAGLLKHLKLITHWNTRCILPNNAPALTVSLLSVVKQGDHTIGEQRMLFRVLQHIMDNNFEAQREVFYTLKENQPLAYSLDQTYHAIRFEELQNENSLQIIKDVNQSILKLPPEYIWTVKTVEDPNYWSLDLILVHLLRIMASQNYQEFHINDKRLVMLLFNYIANRNQFLHGRLNEKMMDLPHKSHYIVFEKELIIDSVDIPPLIESLERNLFRDKKAAIWRTSLPVGNDKTEVAKFSAAIPKLKNYIGYFIENQRDLKNTVVDEHTERLNSVLKRLSSLKLSAPWEPAVDVQNPNSLYTIVNDALKGVRAPDRSVRACAAYHRVFQFLEEELPDSEPSKKVARIFEIDPELQQTERLNDQWKPLYELMERTSISSPLWSIISDLITSDKSQVFAEPRSEQTQATIAHLLRLCSHPKMITRKSDVLSQISRDAFMILNILAIGSKQIREEILTRLSDDIELAKAIMLLITSGFTSYSRAQDFPVGSISQAFLNYSLLYEQTTRLLVCEELEKMVDPQDYRIQLMTLPTPMSTSDYEQGKDLAHSVVEYLESAPCLPDMQAERNCLAFRYSLASRTRYESEVDYDSVSSIVASSAKTRSRLRFTNYIVPGNWRNLRWWISVLHEIKRTRNWNKSHIETSI